MWNTRLMSELVTATACHKCSFAVVLERSKLAHMLKQVYERYILLWYSFFLIYNNLCIVYIVTARSVC